MEDPTHSLYESSAKKTPKHISRCVITITSNGKKHYYKQANLVLKSLFELKKHALMSWFELNQS